MRFYRPWLLAAATASGLVLAMQPAVAAPANPAAAAPAAKGFSAKTKAQLDALAAAKLARTPAQRKVDSPLLAAAQVRRGAALPSGVRSAPVPLDKSGRTLVEIRGTVNRTLLAKVRAAGGVVKSSSAKRGVLRVALPVNAVEPLAGSSQVRRISSVAAASVTARAVAPRKPVSKEARASVLRRNLAGALRTGKVRAAAGSVVTEGDVTLGVDTAREALKVSGVGVTVGVLSDGVDSLAASVATGDLPADVQVLPGQAGGGNEGTAMLEIVHDLAPKAKLAFGTANNGVDGFADNIRALRAAGADVIVDDVLYFVESPFQDGTIARAVREVTADGALFFSSAGNEGNVTDGTSGNWEGDFRSSGTTIGKFAGVPHDFDPGAAVQPINPVTPGSAGAPAILHWANPLGGAGDDYDLYALDPSGNVVGFSNDVQDGNDDPFEGFFLPDAGGASLRIAVVKFSGADRYFQVTAFRGRFAADGALPAFATPGVTRGHSAVPAAFSVAAVPAHERLPFELEPGDPPNPVGPFPYTYDGMQLSERFTSDGPRRVFFRPDGTAITPGNLTSTGGQVRRKPDLAAADGVHTTAPGFDPFFGTSASAPHAAAIAALMVSGKPGITPAQVRRALLSTSLDIEAPGRDRDTGAGIVQAGPALRAARVRAQPFVTAGDITIASTTDGDRYLEPGETGVVRVPATNVGDAAANGVSVALATTAPGVTVSPARRGYGNLAVGATRTMTYRVRVPASIDLGSAVTLRATARFRGAYSPQTSETRIVIGQPSTTVIDAGYAGAPVDIPDADQAGATAPIAVSGVGPLSGLTVSVDGSSCTTDEGATTVGVNHTFVGDLTATLTAPDGTSIPLFAQAGGPGDNLCQVVFTDDATRAWSSALPEEAPFTGDWLPETPLSAVAGTQANGTWRFTIVDNAPIDTGTLRAVSLHLRGYVSPA